MNTGREGPISEEEIRKIFSLSWRRILYEKESKLRLGSDLEGFGDALPQPIVVGCEAIRSGRFHIGQIVTLTTFSPSTGDARKGQFMVVGGFKTGLYEHDLRTIYTTLPAACEFVDSFDPELEGAYTWWSFRGGARSRNVGWRIDYATTTPELGDSVKEIVHHPDILGSDHCPLHVDL